MPGLALITILLSTFLCVVCAVVAWKQASACSRLLKRVRELELMTADLNSHLDGLLESHKRLRSREGMRELRERRLTANTRQPETKAQLLQRMGLSGKAGPEFARAQLSLVGNADHSD